jgi:hypothetical protein
VFSYSIEKFNEVVFSGKCMEKSLVIRGIMVCLVTITSMYCNRSVELNSFNTYVRIIIKFCN